MALGKVFKKGPSFGEVLTQWVIVDRFESFNKEGDRFDVNAHKISYTVPYDFSHGQVR